MIGQGSPDLPCRRTTLCGSSGCVLVWVLLLLLRVIGAHANDGEPVLGMRIQWGGSGPWQWTGRLWLSEGELREPRTIINSADASGSIFVDGHSVRIVQPRSRLFDGFDVLAVGAPGTALLNVELHRKDLAAPYPPIQVPLDDLFHTFRKIKLDEQENQLLVERIPGDELAVRFDSPRSHLVFDPGEELNVKIIPNVPARPGVVPMRLTAELYNAEGTRVGEPSVQELKADLRGGFVGLNPIVMRLPHAQGVYDLDVRLSEFRSRRRFAISKTTPVASRKIQLVVIDTRPKPLPDVDVSREVTRIEPAGPGWKNFLIKPLKNISGWETNRPSDNDRSRIWQHENRSFVQLEPGGWQAYPVSISQPGVPHILEVTYPADIPQTLTMGVVEAAEPEGNATAPFHSGVHVPEDLVEEAGSLRQHRMVFWPHTTNPRIVLTNRQADGAAAFGTIRILEWTSGLEPTALKRREENPRQFLAYFEQPWFTKNFNAAEFSSKAFGLHDWQTFYEGGTRLVEYLKYVGHDGALLSAYGQGSTLYPSRLLEPNAKYDTGALLPSGQDPFRKDVLEMLFRLFDREGLKLVPLLRFETPLPALERIRRVAHTENGIRLIRETGRPWTATENLRDGTGPYYNPLNPHVQAAMLEVVQELVGRYKMHPSFQGLAIDLSPNGFAVLPGPYWGLDDQTVASFVRDTRVILPGQGDRRYAERVRYLQQHPEAQQQWLAWRASQIAAFHHRIHSAVLAQLETAKLFLVSSDLLDNLNIRNVLAPALSAKGDVELAQTMLELGIDPPAYSKDDRIVLVQPRGVDFSDIPDSGQNLLRIDRIPEADFYFRGIPNSGCLLFHRPLELMSDEWTDMLRPGATGQSRTGTLLLSPSGATNRRRFAEALARCDAQVLIEGGVMLPLGQEDSVRDFLDIFRRLPAAPFTDVQTESAAEPAVIRQLTRGERNCVYLVNESSWDIQVEMQLRMPNGIAPPASLSPTELPAPIRRGDETWWTVPLRPFGLAAAWFETPQLEILSARAILPDHVEPQLKQRIQHLFDRLAQLERAPKLDLPGNPSFEGDPFDSSNLNAWESRNPNGGRVTWQPVGAYAGKHCLRITTRNGDLSNWVRSAPFVAPATGRFQTQVYLRVTDAAQQPQLRLTLEVNAMDKPVDRRSAAAGKNSNQPLSEMWAKYILPVDDLPLDGITDMRIRIDVLGEGDVWVDDVQTSALAPFSVNELRELTQIIGLAKYHLRSPRNISKCQQVLDSYWPRFLEKHVPLPNLRIAAQPQITPLPVPQPSPTDEKQQPWYERMRKRFTPRWPWF